MKLIFAQGNPGKDYSTTRHNVGFMALDALASEKGVALASKPKFYADIAELTIAGEKVLLVKPTTFYNETGQSARSLVDFYKLDTASDVLVIHDDLALPLGKIRIREKGSDAGNNGIKSLNAHLGPNYNRIRIGIENDLRSRMGDMNFVLGHFSKDEAATLEEVIIPKTIELIERFCAGELETTSHSL
jgi:PTH1 family peptidyl-tRNA hydrolase